MLKFPYYNLQGIAKSKVYWVAINDCETSVIQLLNKVDANFPKALFFLKILPYTQDPIWLAGGQLVGSVQQTKL